jgi:hypothetical protein
MKNARTPNLYSLDDYPLLEDSHTCISSTWDTTGETAMEIVLKTGRAK